MRLMKNRLAQPIPLATLTPGPFFGGRNATNSPAALRMTRLGYLNLVLLSRWTELAKPSNRERLAMRQSSTEALRVTSLSVTRALRSCAVEVDDAEVASHVFLRFLAKQSGSSNEERFKAALWKEVYVRVWLKSQHLRLRGSL